MRVDIKFKTYREAVDHVRWLRANLNDRGSDWDFVFMNSQNKLSIVIRNDKIATWYRLAFPQAEISNDIYLR